MYFRYRDSKKNPDPDTNQHIDIAKNFAKQNKFFLKLFWTNYILLFRITINNFSDSHNKIK